MLDENRRLIREAANLLACCASQPESAWWCTFDLPGRWSIMARDLALRIWTASARSSPDEWREVYAEAEARLRKELE